MSAVLWQRVEGGLVLLAVMVAVVPPNALGGGWPWWLLALLFFAPDAGVAGYLAGPRVGAIAYNALHLYGVWLALAACGFAVSGDTTPGLLGLLWAGHVGLDRMLGYGLKESTGFGNTHLGRIGRGPEPKGR